LSATPVSERIFDGNYSRGMKILHVSTNDFGGAAIACIRLHRGLLERGVDSRLLLLRQTDKLLPRAKRHMPPAPSLVERVSRKTRRLLGEFRICSPAGVEKHLVGRPDGYEIFTFPFSSCDIRQDEWFRDADIVNVHWAVGLIDYPTFFRGHSKNVVWTLHDMNPFTGGCHYSSGCVKFRDRCEDCPQLQGTVDPDFSSVILAAKCKALSHARGLTVVAPSVWLRDLSKSSKAFGRFNNVHIPNGADSGIFQPRDKQYSRQVLGLPPDKKVILFVADSISNKRKGYQYLIDAFQSIARKNEVVLCSVGSKDAHAGAFENHYEMGVVTNERLMSVVYSAADLFVIPSLEDNLPNTLLESLLCGVPAIGFPAGGVKDVIEHGVNGFLTEDISVPALTAEIDRFVSDPQKFDASRIRNDAVRKYSSAVQADAYIAQYTVMLRNEKATQKV